MRRLALIVVGVVAAVVMWRWLTSPSVTNPVPIGETVICFGDSLTAGTGAGAGEGFPERLAELIGEPVVNAGRPGDTTASALSRLDRDVLSRSPRIVCITLGGNDLKNGVPREEAFRNLEAIVRRIQEPGALVVLGGLELPLLGRGFDDAYEELAASTGAVLVPNVYKGILGRPGMMSDPVHPNAAGYRVMADHFYRALKPYL